MQKERVMLRVAGGIPYELTRGRVKRLNLHVRRDGTVPQHPSAHDAGSG